VEGVLFDLNYFKYCFLKASEIDFHELKLEADFRLLAKDLTAIPDSLSEEESNIAEQSASFLYRDFQARNVMLKDEQPFFIDFQGGRRGPFYYDLASFLWQASQ
jgi:aminoglycoside/choline kinase family phosphotransferase